MTAYNLHAMLRALPGLEGRTPDTPEADLGPAFGPTIPYRDGFVSTVKFSGVSAWERHSGDEILLITDGGGCLVVGDRPQTLHPGTMVIVPAGEWHRIEAPDGIAMITVSPQPSDHRAVL